MLSYVTVSVIIALPPLPPGRVVAPGESKTIGSHVFSNWGSHHDCYPTAYFTVAAAIGMSRGEVDVFVERLDKVFVKFRKKHAEDNLPA